MYPLLTPEEYEIWASIRRLGGAKKVKELLESLEKYNLKIEDLLKYLKSIDYKVPTSIESRLAELEKRVSALESGKPHFKEWTDEEIKKYLDECAEWHKPTYFYYKILTEATEKISRKELLVRLSELLGKQLKGQALAGIQAGITMSVTKRSYERLDWKDEKSQQFSINEKYREKLRNYFKQEAKE
jgi:hypothetical protein